MGDVINLDEYRKRRADENDKPKGGPKGKKRKTTGGSAKTPAKKPKGRAPETKVD